MVKELIERIQFGKNDVMKRIMVGIVLLTMMMLLCGCQSNESSVESSEKMPEIQPRKIIIDTDTGGDDATAIIMAALCPEIDIKGVTVVAGNVELEQGAKNALMSVSYTHLLYTVCGANVS